MFKLKNKQFLYYFVLQHQARSREKISVSEKVALAAVGSAAFTLAASLILFKLIC